MIMRTCIVLLSMIISTAHATKINLSAQEAADIGRKIWHNECAGSVEKLTWWKNGEEFASLGIGHFIWFPRNYNGPFTQTFPSLVDFLAKNGVSIPTWLAATKEACPWNSREDFYKEINSQQMHELRTLLVSTVELQTQFITQRLMHALPRMIKRLSAHNKEHVKQQFLRVAQSPMGLYALIDYTNFKGEGTNPQEKYSGKGWGLLHVLSRMKGSEVGTQALQEFAQAARHVLTERVQHAPKERNEGQWLPGWTNRVNTYVTASKR